MSDESKSKYVVIKPTESNCGMCGYIWQALRTIYSMPKKKYYIDFSDCMYKPAGDQSNMTFKTQT